MVFVGDLQIQINFTQKNQYRARMVAAPLILGGHLKISDQNNWGGGRGGPEQKIKFGGELNWRGDIKF